MYVEIESFDMIRGLILGSSVSHVCSLEDGEFPSLFSRADVRTRILELILVTFDVHSFVPLALLASLVFISALGSTLSCRSTCHCRGVSSIKEE